MADLVHVSLKPDLYYEKSLRHATHDMSLRHATAMADLYYFVAVQPSGKHT